MENIKKYAAEFIGTFWLTLGGCGAAVLAAGFPEVGIGLLGVSLAFGLTVLGSGGGRAVPRVAGSALHHRAGCRGHRGGRGALRDCQRGA